MIRQNMPPRIDVNGRGQHKRINSFRTASEQNMQTFKSTRHSTRNKSVRDGSQSKRLGSKVSQDQDRQDRGNGQLGSAKNLLDGLRMMKQQDAGIVPIAATAGQLQRDNNIAAKTTIGLPPASQTSRKLNQSENKHFASTQNFKTLSAIEQISAKSTHLLQGGVVKPTIKKMRRGSEHERTQNVAQTHRTLQLTTKLSPQKENLVGDMDDAFTTIKNQPKRTNYQETTVVQAPRFEEMSTQGFSGAKTQRFFRSQMPDSKIDGARLLMDRLDRLLWKQKSKFIEKLRVNILPHPLRAALAEKNRQNDPYKKLRLISTDESAETPYQRERYQTEINPKEPKNPQKQQLALQLSEQIRQFKADKKFEKDKRDRDKRLNKIEAMMEDFKKEKLAANRGSNIETPNTIRTDQNSSICKEGTVDLKRKQFVKNFAIEKEKSRQGLAKFSSASNLPPYVHQNYSNTRRVVEAQSHKEKSMINRHASENVSDNDPVKIVDVYSVNSPQILVSDNRVSRSNSRTDSNSERGGNLQQAMNPSQSAMRVQTGILAIQQRVLQPFNDESEPTLTAKEYAETLVAPEEQQRYYRQGQQRYTNSNVFLQPDMQQAYATQNLTSNQSFDSLVNGVTPTDMASQGLNPVSQYDNFPSFLPNQIDHMHSEAAVEQMSNQLQNLRAQQMSMIEMKASVDCQNNFNQSTNKSKKLQAKIVLLQLLLKFKDLKRASLRHGFSAFKQNCGSLSEKESVALVKRRRNLLQKYFLLLRAGETKQRLDFDGNVSQSSQIEQAPQPEPYPVNPVKVETVHSELTCNQIETNFNALTSPSLESKHFDLPSAFQMPQKDSRKSSIIQAPTQSPDRKKWANQNRLSSPLKSAILSPPIEKLLSIEQQQAIKLAQLQDLLRSRIQILRKQTLSLWRYQIQLSKTENIHHQVRREYQAIDYREKKHALKLMTLHLDKHRKSVMLRAFLTITKLPPKKKEIEVYRSKSPLRKATKSPLRKSPLPKSPIKSSTVAAKSPKRTIPKSPVLSKTQAASPVNSTKKTVKREVSKSPKPQLTKPFQGGSDAKSTSGRKVPKASPNFFTSNSPRNKNSATNFITGSVLQQKTK